MLQPAEIAIGIAAALGKAGVEQIVPGRHPEQRDVAKVAGQAGMMVRMPQHQALHGELDVDHAAAIVLEVEEAAAVGVCRVQLFSHL